MDLGCIDMGCIEKPRKEISTEKENSPKESKISASTLGKNTRTKDSMRSSSNALNKLSSQIAKPPHRKTSPLTWFPRKKVEPYLKRKIKLLQEVDGMQPTLDETLGNSNPHYSKVLREKMAIKEAADKAMEARKAAMIEASWCRILRAAGIESKVAEAQLLIAEKSADEACQAAEAIGVILNDIPDCAQNRCKIEAVSSKGGESATHTVSATFETVFEVDKQVAAAVKAAFIKLAGCPSVKKDEFQELLRKISQNPDTDECHRDFPLDLEFESNADKFKSSHVIELMLDRLRCLKEEELASLATIVATCGLNASLAEDIKNPWPKADSSRTSFGGRITSRNSISDAQSRRTAEAELPSLDKFLVKRLTRLEREILEAKNAGKSESTNKHTDEEICSVDNASSRTKERLTTISDIKLEREEVREGKEMQKALTESVGSETKAAVEIPSVDKFLVKHLTGLEREVQLARNRRNMEPTEGSGMTDSSTTATLVVDKAESNELLLSTDGDSLGKENVDMNKNRWHRDIGAKISQDSNYESLDSVLVKHVSRLEREKMRFRADEVVEAKPKQQDAKIETESNKTSLEQILVKQKSRLEKEREKTATTDEQHEGTRYSVSRRQAREKELQAAWGGLSLGNSIRPHVSRLERQKASFFLFSQHNFAFAC
ncbi:hypothetical protein F511_27934 [Dorcoceras hygrometricum]|uniref:Uncharacterized protein n=1 Tax=Dorcoceras hygrometricum TaxID=472368 RepID=A0A2Z7DDR6_9LAMI|nr:hypothetical protein F511_27934 [Dorcoceras hygrometricum]